MIEIPGYYLKRTIGTGGMATVYLAVQESLDREVALKVMTPVLAADETFAARFRREARTIGKLSHPHIVQIYDVGTTPDNHNYFSMQYLPGGTLKDRLDKRLDEMEVYRIFTGVLKALGFAHELGFVHRDVKPENILFDVADTPILTDFGIARALRSSTRITQTGMSVGTSRYMSPEQARGGSVDARSDLYAMGVVLYEALTGSPPFDAEDTFAVAYAHVNDPVPTLPNGLKDWNPVIHRALSKNPRERYPTAESFIHALEDMARRHSKEGVLGKSGKGTGITRIFSRNDNGSRPKSWRFWRRKPREDRTEQLRTPLAIPSPFSRRLLARLRPWLPSAMRRPVWRVVQVLDESVTAVSRRLRKKRRKGSTPWVYFGGGLVLVALAGLVWYFAGRPSVPLGWWQPEAEPARDALAVEQQTETGPARDVPASAGTDTRPAGQERTDAGGEGTELDAVGPRTPFAAADAVTGNDVPDEPVVPASRDAGDDPVATLLEDAGEALAANRLTTPPGSDALGLYEQVLNREPGNEEAREGLRQIVLRYLSLSGDALASGDPDRSAVFLMRATEVASSHEVNGDLSDSLDAARRSTFDRLMASGREASNTGDLPTARERWSLAGRLMPGESAPRRALAALEQDIAGDSGTERFRDVMSGGGQGPEMMRVPAGEFEMGNDASGTVTVTVDRPFAMSRREITVAEFQRFAEASGYAGADHGCEVYENKWQYYEQFNWQSPGFPQQADHPVVCVSWNDAQAYVAWLSVQTGEGYRLPSEAEWEYALSTGSDMSEMVCSQGNIADLWLRSRFPREEAFDCADGSYFTASVGSWPPNEYGLYDLVGNVREWTLDCWNGDHRRRPEGQGAWLSGDCGDRVIKGSSWLTGKPGISPAHRLGEPVDAAYNAVGFRVVREVQADSAGDD